MDTASYQALLVFSQLNGRKADTVHLRFGSGKYSFVVKGSSPTERHCAESTVNQTALKLQCVKPGHLISRVVWAFYGNSNSCSQPLHSLGECHSGASVMVVER